MQVVLVMFRNDGERRSFSVVRNMTMIGRREDCDLRIPVGDVSRKHCRLVRTDDGIRIEDLGSSNGTYVNSERIQECDLHPGDVVGVGPVQFIVQIDGVPDEDDMEPPIAELPPPSQHTGPPPMPPQPMHEDEPTADLTELEEIPAEPEFQIEDEPVVTQEAPGSEAAALEEVPADEAALEEEPPSQADQSGSTQELDVGETTELEEPAAGEGPTSGESPAHPGESATASEALDDSTLDDPEIESADGLEFEHEDSASAGHTPDSPQSPVPPQAPTDSLDELEFDESVEPKATAHDTSVEESKPQAAEDVSLELAPAAPAYDAVDIDANDQPAEELELDEEHANNGHAPSEAASESSWDLVIEEADSTRSHHDFKIDLDSPHEQTHGQG